MADNNCIVNGTGRVTSGVEGPPLSYSSIDVVMGGNASGVVLLLWPDKGVSISSEILSSVKSGEVGIVTARIDGSATPDSLKGGTVELHALAPAGANTRGSVGFKTTSVAGEEMHWTGQADDGSVSLVGVTQGSINVEKA